QTCFHRHSKCYLLGGLLPQVLQMLLFGEQPCPHGIQGAVLWEQGLPAMAI
ncbi:hypothetical protein CFII68_00970, partial [Pseudomonas sp. CFII68]